MSPPIDKLYICDCDLESFKGHYLMEAIAIREAAKKIGIDTYILGNKKLFPEIAKQYDISPVLADGYFAAPTILKNIWRKRDQQAESSTNCDSSNLELPVTPNVNTVDEPCRAGFLKKLLSLTPAKFLLRNYWVKRSIKKLINSTKGDAKTLYLFNSSTFYTITRVLSGLIQNRLQIHVAFYSHICLEPGEVAQIRQLLAQRDKNVHSMFFWSSEIHVERHQALGLEQARLIPIPLAARLCPEADNSENNNLTLTFLGQSSYRKGFHLLPELVTRVRRAFPNRNINFDIQYVENENYPQKGLIKEAMLDLKRLGVNLITDKLDDGAYIDILTRANIILLPYQLNGDDSHYANGGSSGILIEALANAKVVIVPTDSWLALQVAKTGNGKCFTTAEDFYAKTIAAIKEYGTLAIQAENGKQYWRQEHSPEKFIATLIHHFNNSTNSVSK